MSFSTSASQQTKNCTESGRWSQVNALFKSLGKSEDITAYTPPLQQQGVPQPDTRALEVREASSVPSSDAQQSNTEKRPLDSDQEVNDSKILQGSHKIRDQLIHARIIGQLHQSYILLETKDGLWLLDQHIIHERILYERFLKAAKARPPVQQILPVSMEFSAQASEAIWQTLDRLWNLGVELEEFGPQTFLLRGIPQELSRNSNHWERDILRIAENTEETSWQEKAAVTMACRGAIKAGDRLDDRQIRNLLDRLAETENPFTCPHGRPIIVRLERAEILRRFGRA